MDINKCPACHVLSVVSPPSMKEPLRMYGGHNLLHERLDPNFEVRSGLLLMTTPNVKGLIQQVIRAKRWVFG